MHRRFFAAMSAMSVSIGSAHAETLQLHVARAWVGSAYNTGTPILEIELKPESQAAFAAFTSRHVGETIELRVNGELVMSANLVEPIIGGTLKTMGIDADALDSIVDRIMSYGADVVVGTSDE